MNDEEILVSPEEILGRTNMVECKVLRCKLSVSACIQRQIRGVGEHSGANRYIPIECKQCEQGKEIMKKEGYGPLLAIAEATMQHFDITEEQLKTVNHKRAYEKRVFVWICVEVYKVPMTKMGEYLHKTVVSLQSVLKTVRSSMDIDRNTTEYMKDIEAIKRLVDGEKERKSILNSEAERWNLKSEGTAKYSDKVKAVKHSDVHLSDSDQTSFPISGVLPPASSTEKVCIQISWEMADYPDLMTGLEEAALVDIRSIEHEALYLIVKGLKARQEKSQS